MQSKDQSGQRDPEIERKPLPEPCMYTLEIVKDPLDRSIITILDEVQLVSIAPWYDYGPTAGHFITGSLIEIDRMQSQ